jgi:hypothetical protein
MERTTAAGAHADIDIERGVFAKLPARTDRVRNQRNKRARNRRSRRAAAWLRENAV